MQKLNPDTIIVLVAFLATMAGWVYTQNDSIFTLAATLGGALAGVATRSKTGGETQVDNIERVTNIEK